jgi:hypothetical protein
MGQGQSKVGRRLVFAINRDDTDMVQQVRFSRVRIRVCHFLTPVRDAGRLPPTSAYPQTFEALSITQLTPNPTLSPLRLSPTIPRRCSTRPYGNARPR